MSSKRSGIEGIIDGVLMELPPGTEDDTDGKVKKPIGDYTKEHVRDAAAAIVQPPQEEPDLGKNLNVEVLRSTLLNYELDDSEYGILTLLDQGKLTPDEIALFNKKYLAGETGPSSQELSLRLNEVRNKLAEYKEIFNVEEIVRVQKDFHDLLSIVTVSGKKMIETLQKLLVLYKDKNRRDPGNCQEKINAVLITPDVLLKNN